MNLRIYTCLTKKKLSVCTTAKQKRNNKANSEERGERNKKK